MAGAATASAARRRERSRRPAPRTLPPPGAGRRSGTRGTRALAVAQQLLERGEHEKGCELLAGISDELLKAATTARAERLVGKLGPTLEDVLYAELRRMAPAAGAPR
jgi:hypothetical protein